MPVISVAVCTGGAGRGAATGSCRMGFSVALFASRCTAGRLRVAVFSPAFLSPFTKAPEVARKAELESPGTQPRRVKTRLVHGFATCGLFRVHFRHAGRSMRAESCLLRMTFQSACMSFSLRL